MERHFELQLHLDRMRQIQEECRAALSGLRRGERTRENYRELLARHRDTLRDWEARNRELFDFND